MECRVWNVECGVQSVEVKCGSKVWGVKGGVESVECGVEYLKCGV